MDAPDTNVNCPRCAERMHYLYSMPSGDRVYIGKVLSARTTHIYACVDHGAWRLDLDGMFRPHPRN